MFLQNASFFAKCKLHLARFAVDQTADAVGKEVVLCSSQCCGRNVFNTGIPCPAENGSWKPQVHQQDHRGKAREAAPPIPVL